MGIITQNIFTIKFRTGCSQQKIENFGNDRYLVKVKSYKNEDVDKELIEMFSHHFGIPPNRIRILEGMERETKRIKIER